MDKKCLGRDVLVLVLTLNEIDNIANCVTSVYNSDF